MDGLMRTVQVSNAPPKIVRSMIQSSEIHRIAPNSTKFFNKEDINSATDKSGGPLCVPLVFLEPGQILWRSMLLCRYGRTKLGLIYSSSASCPACCLTGPSSRLMCIPKPLTRICRN